MSDSALIQPDAAPESSEQKPASGMRGFLFSTRVRWWLLSGLGVFATALVTAVVTAIVKDYWEAARPFVEISSISLRPQADEKSVIQITENLVQDMDRHDYYTELPFRTTLKEVQDAIDSAARHDEDWGRLLSRVGRLVDLLKTQSTARDLDERRREFIAEWFQKASTDDSDLDRIAKVVLFDYEQKLPAKYRVVPDKPPSPNLVSLPYATITLAEVDEEKIISQIGPDDPGKIERVRREAHRTNLLRRLWRYYEPDVLIPFLQEIGHHIDTCVKDAAQITQGLKNSMESARPKRIAVTALITNRGTAPLALRAVGVLKINVPKLDGSGISPLDISLSGSEGPDAVVVVDGGKAAVYSFVSDKSLEQLAAENTSLLGGDEWAPGKSIEKARVSVLYEGAGLSAQLILAKAGVDQAKSRVTPSALRPFGKATHADLLKRLSE